MEQLRRVEAKLDKEGCYPRFTLDQFFSKRIEIEISHNGRDESIVINEAMLRAIRKMCFRGTAFKHIYNKESWSH